MVLNFRPEYSLSPDLAFPANRSRLPSLASSESASFSSTPASSPFHPRKSCTSSLAGSDTAKDYDHYSVEKCFPSVLSSGQNSEADWSGMSSSSSVPPSPSFLFGQRTVVVKILLRQNCSVQNIQEELLKMNGVEAVTIDGARDLATVKEAIGLPPYYKQTIKGKAKVVPARKNDGAAVQREKGGGGRETEEKEASVPAAKREAGGGSENKFSGSAGAGYGKKEVGTVGGVGEKGKTDGGDGGEKKQGNGCSSGGGQKIEGACGGGSGGGSDVGDGGDGGNKSDGGGRGSDRSGASETVVNAVDYRQVPMNGCDGRGHGRDCSVDPPLSEIRLLELFSDENAHSCSIM